MNYIFGYKNDILMGDKKQVDGLQSPASSDSQILKCLRLGYRLM
jgi:hypothetical protein